VSGYVSEAAWEQAMLADLLAAALDFHDNCHGEGAAVECDAICEPALAIRDRRRERSSTVERCHAGSDGDCSDERCPQLRDGEPARSGRHCPLDVRDEMGGR
jgi:hypothetical protein